MGIRRGPRRRSAYHDDHQYRDEGEGDEVGEVVIGRGRGALDGQVGDGEQCRIVGFVRRYEGRGGDEVR